MAVWTRQEQNVRQLKDVIRSSLNPITYDDNDLPNIITRVVMPPHVQRDVCCQEEIGQPKYVAFVEERINKKLSQYLGQNEEDSSEDVEECKKSSEAHAG